MGETNQWAQNSGAAGSKTPEEIKSSENPRKDASKNRWKKSKKQGNSHANPVMKWEGQCNKIKTHVFDTAGMNQAN